jgi:hypothetical protein
MAAVQPAPKRQPHRPEALHEHESPASHETRPPQALQHNQHAIACELTGGALGNMLSPEGALFNHACAPNAAWRLGPLPHCPRY